MVGKKNTWDPGTLVMMHNSAEKKMNSAIIPDMENLRENNNVDIIVSINKKK